ncbi:MAG TPA: D-alanyl-D-alanine carboxypeptidase family protein [Limnochordia bacterium]|nr:D-alanyl-D-alanine carboxypeptidase family protein [Limnochordia bacterium]
MRSWQGAVLAAVAVLCWVGAPLAAGSVSAPPELSAIAYAVYDADYDYLVLEKNAHQRRSIASITKVMTLLVAAELVEAGKIGLGDEVTVSARAASREGTQINLKAGDRLTVEELLYASALQSANDAAVALAEYVAGSEAEFAKLMNAKAQELGLRDTHYVDCTGLLSMSSNNYSTASDQARLLAAALNSQLVREILRAPDYFLKSQNRKITNSHPLLDSPGVEGGKTGATTPAGHTLITSCVRHGRRLIAVVLGARTREIRNSENEALLEWAFGNLRTLISTEEVQARLIVPDGVHHQVDAVLAREFSVVVRDDQDREFTAEVELKPKLRAPIDAGDKVGELVVRRADGVTVRLDLVARQSTGLATWLRRLFNHLRHFFGRLGE